MVIPKPFVRDSVSLGGAKKSWRHVPAQEIRVGDLVAGVGLVKSISRSGGMPHLINDTITFVNPPGEQHSFPPDEVLLGFVSDAS